MSLLIISKNYWGANLSEFTAKRFEDVFIKLYPNSIHKLIGNDVNLNNVKKTISNWVNENYKKYDILFLYINGHGNQTYDTNNEESDNMDELLQLPDGNLLDDDLTNIINNSINTNLDKNINDNINTNLNKKPIIFLISDHCSSGSMLDKIDKLKYDWISIGSSLDNQDSLMTGDGNVMTIQFLDILEKYIQNNDIEKISIIQLFNTLKQNMMESFIGELQTPTLNVSHDTMYDIKPFSK